MPNTSQIGMMLGTIAMMLAVKFRSDKNITIQIVSTAPVIKLDASDAIDSVYFKDPAGLLTPDRVRDLVPRLRARLTRTPFRELHSHASTGLAPVTLLEAAEHGMDILHTALPPLAYTSSRCAGR